MLIKKLKNIGEVTLYTIAAQGLTVISMPLITRLYGAESLGIFALFVSLTSILSIFGTLKLEQIIMLSKNKFIDFYVTKTVNNFSIFSIVIFFASIFLIDEFKNLFYLLLISIPLECRLIVSRVFLNKNKHLSRYGLTFLLQSATQLIFRLFFLLLLSNYFTLIVSYLISQVITLIYVECNVKDHQRIIYRARKLYLLRSFIFLRRNLIILKFLIPSDLIALVISNFIVVFGSYMYGSSEIGKYALALSMVGLPARILGNALAAVYKKEVLSCNEAFEVKKVALSQFKMMLLIFTFPSFIVYMYSIDLFEFVFGKEWGDAGLYAKILAPMVILQISSRVLSYNLIVNNRSNEIFYAQIVNSLGFVAAYIVSLNYNLGLIYMATSCSIIQSITYAYVLRQSLS